MRPHAQAGWGYSQRWNCLQQRQQWLSSSDFVEGRTTIRTCQQLNREEEWEIARVQEKVDAVTGRSPHSLTHPVTDPARQRASVPTTKDYHPINGIGAPPYGEVPVF